MVLNFFKNKLASWLSLVFVVLSTAIVLFVNIDVKFMFVFLSFIGLFSLFFLPMEWLFYFVVLLFPVTTRFYSAFNAYAVDFVSFVFISIFALKFVYSFLFAEKQKLNFPLIFPFILFLLSAGLSIFNSFDKVHSIYWIGYLIFLYCAYILFPVNVLNKKYKILIVLNIIVFIGLIDAFAGAASLYSQIENNLIYGATPISIFGKNFLGTNRNSLAQILVLAAPAAMACFYIVKYKSLKKIYAFAVFFFVAVDILTLTRSSVISLMVVLFLVVAGSTYIYNKKNIDKVIVTFLFFATICFAGIMFFFSNSGREGYDGSMNYRVGVAQLSISMFNYHPLIGNGIGMFKGLLASDAWYSLEYGWGGVTEAHSWAQKILVEQGLIGVATFVLFLSLLYFFAIRFIMNESKDKKDRMVMLFLLAMATSQIVYNLFDWMYYNFRMWIPISLVLAFLIINKEDLSITNLKPVDNVIKKIRNFLLNIKILR